MLKLNTTLVPDEKDFALHDTILRQLDLDMAKYPGLILEAGFTTARGLDGTTQTWKVEARDRKTNGKKITTRYPNIENGSTMTDLWFEMHGKSYEFWLKRSNDKLLKPKEPPVSEPPLKIKPPFLGTHQ